MRCASGSNTPLQFSGAGPPIKPGGGKISRGIRVSSYDPDDPNGATQQQHQGYNSGSSMTGIAGNTSWIASKTLGNQRKFMPGGQRVATISQNYNEKTMLLSSDDEYQ